MVCGVLLLLVAVILVDSLRVWVGILRGTREARVSEVAVRAVAAAGGGTMKPLRRSDAGWQLLRELADENAYRRHLEAPRRACTRARSGAASRTSACARSTRGRSAAEAVLDPIRFAFWLLPRPVA